MFSDRNPGRRYWPTVVVKTKNGCLEAFLDFLMLSVIRSFTWLDAGFIKLPPIQMPSKFHESKTFKGHLNREGYFKYHILIYTKVKSICIIQKWQTQKYLTNLYIKKWGVCQLLKPAKAAVTSWYFLHTFFNNLKHQINTLLAATFSQCHVNIFFRVFIQDRLAIRARKLRNTYSSQYSLILSVSWTLYMLKHQFNFNFFDWYDLVIWCYVILSSSVILWKYKHIIMSYHGSKWFIFLHNDFFKHAYITHIVRIMNLNYTW